MSGNEDRRPIESILREPLTRHRFLLNSKIRAAQTEENPQPFTFEDFKAFAESIPTKDVTFKSEVENVLEAVRSGQAPQLPLFNTPEKQLLWGAGLGYLKLNPDVMKTWQPAATTEELIGTNLWKQITGTKMAYQELLRHAHHVREALRDKDTKYIWGEPGTGFGFSREKNIINIDMMQTMIVGFEHARADVYREIGRALLTLSYPTRMQALYTEMQPLLRKAAKSKAKKGPELKPEEYKQLRLLSAEWSLRQMMFDAAEENVANRFVCNIGSSEGGSSLQDYSVSLNNTAVTQRAIGLTRLPEPKNASEELRRYLNLCNAVQLSFFQNNALFEDTNTGWNRVGVDPNLVRKTETLAKRPDDAKNDTVGVDHDDFKYLRELAGGPKGLENLQPKQHERLYGLAGMLNRLKVMDKDRKEVIETIWDLYAEELIQKILKQTNDQVDQQLKDAKDKQQQQQDQQDQDGEQQEGDQDGESQEGEGQEGEGQPGQGKPGKGQKGKQDKKDKKKKPEHGKQQGERQDPDDMDGEKSDGEKGDKQKGDKQDQDGDPQEGEGSEGDEQESEDQDGEGAEGDLGADKEDSVPVEGAGDMPGVDNPTEDPSDEVDPDADGQDADGQDGEGEDADGEDADGDDQDGEDADDDAMSEEELEKAAREAEKADQEGEEADGEGEGEGEDADGDGDGPGKKGKKKGQKPGKGKGAGHGDGRTLADLAKQDWRDYPKRIEELSGQISMVRKLFKKVQELQLQKQVVQSKTLEMLPEGGELKERFDLEAHRSLTIKKLTGSVEEEDLKRFRKDENIFVPTELDIVILIDGSGSMGMDSYKVQGVTPLQSALQASAILYEAAAGKDMKMNVYVGMWGNSEPPIHIKPGDDRVKVGQAMELMRKGLNSGTDFAPAVKKVAETIGEQHGESGTLTGFTHVLVITDGDSADKQASKEKMATMFQYSDKVTFDVAIITAKKDTAMEGMAKDLGGKKPSQEVGVVLGSDPNQVPLAIVGLLLEKVRKCGSFKAVPNNKKRAEMKKALNKMDPKK